MLDLLKGIRVLSFNHFLFGPMGVQALGDMGADVISVESTEGAWQRHWSSGDIWNDGQGMLHMCANRNKRSIGIDLKSEKGKEIAFKLIDSADVVAENFRPGVFEKLGFGYDVLKKRNPNIIFASASGYGPSGPYYAKPGQDLLAQALFGMAAITGQAHNGPRPAGVSIIDHHGAAVYAMGILGAIVRRERTGKGCRVDTSLMQAALDLQSASLTAYLNAEKKPEKIHAYKNVGGWYYAAPYGVYKTKDSHIALSISPLALIGETIGEPKLASYTEQETWTKQDEIGDLLAARLTSKTTAEWCSLMEPVKIWHAPIQDYARIAADPQVAHMKAIVTVPGAGATKAPVSLVNHPIMYDGEAAEVALPPQRLGAQTEEILAELGIDKAAVDALAKDGVVTVLKD